VKLPDAYQPDVRQHEVYQKYFAVFERLSMKLNDEFEAIANLQ
jgi:gluconokinase